MTQNGGGADVLRVCSDLPLYETNYKVELSLGGRTQHTGGEVYLFFDTNGLIQLEGLQYVWRRLARCLVLYFSADRLVWR